LLLVLMLVAVALPAVSFFAMHARMLDRQEVLSNNYAVRDGPVRCRTLRENPNPLNPQYPARTQRLPIPHSQTTMVELTALRKEVGEMRAIEQELKEARSELMLARLSLKNAATKLGKTGSEAVHSQRGLLDAEPAEGDEGNAYIWDASQRELHEAIWTQQVNRR